MAESSFDLRIVNDAKDLARRGAEIFVNSARASLLERSQFSVVLSGGETPRLLYETLAASEFKTSLLWGKTHFFWGDERNVPPDHPESNFHMAWESLLSHLPIPPSNIHRIRTELGDPALVAADYEETLRSFFGLTEGDEKPGFDFSFLGLGSDGHTASLFSDGVPGINIEKDDPDRLVIAPWVEHLNSYRISLTPRAFNSSSTIVFLASGTRKSKILSELLEGERSGRVYPVDAIHPRNAQPTWLVDRAAAGFLKKWGEL